jgi:hypothetical protein
MTQPYTGSNSPLFYCEELTPGVTPDSPVWKPLRTTAGMPIVVRDLTESNELNATRDSSKPRLGNKQINGEVSVEYTASSQDDILAGAMMGMWQDGETEAGLDITVNALAKTFTRAAGDFTAQVAVGDFIAFIGLTGENAKPFFVTAVSALAVTAGESFAKLTDEVGTAITYKTGSELQIASVCKTFSVLCILNGMCGTDTKYLLSRGIRFVGFNIEFNVNDMITGASQMIGTSQEPLDAQPAGSTFPPEFYMQEDPFHAVDAIAYEDGVRLRNVDAFSITNDNSASAIFELGNDSVAFVEMTKAKNTFSASGKMSDIESLRSALNEESSTFKITASNQTGALAFKLNNCTFMVTPDRGGPESITQAFEGQAAIADDGESSLVIYRIVY